jgi:5-methylcytosine-specific restriction protein B
MGSMELEKEVQEFKDKYEKNYIYNSMSENFILNLSLENTNWFWRVVWTFHKVFRVEYMDNYFGGSRASSNGKKEEKGNKSDRYDWLSFGFKKKGAKASKPIVTLWNWKKDDPCVVIRNDSIEEKMRNKYNSINLTTKTESIQEIERWVKRLHNLCDEDFLEKYKGNGNLPNYYIGDEDTDDEDITEQKRLSNDENNSMKHPLNQILFGTAGTGKTYHTINKALAIIENKYEKDYKKEDRTDLKIRFDNMVKEDRIAFVTFHQSFSYEDFVEGIRVITNEKSNQIEYKVQDGMFKMICEKARRLDMSDDNIEVKISEFIKKVKEQPLTLKTKIGKEFIVSSNENGILFAKTSNDKDVPLLINHIKRYFKDGMEKIIDAKSYEWAISKELYKDFTLDEKPYVLIIDEINRGNISRIFGELITLIEESKREGNDEALSLILPYSQKSFCVPKNLYIIGTMNSSDRSLTGIDIALRRRFEFIEMMPDPNVLESINVDGIDVQKLLKTINQRIEVLLDRDHTIGHANFMKLKDNPELSILANIFRKQVIPLLQEYFYDDWERIDLVLNRNGMITHMFADKGIKDLFSVNDIGKYKISSRSWQVDEDRFDDINSYLKIYNGKSE